MEDLCGVCGEPMKDRGYKAYGCELCPAWLHAKCVFPNALEAKLKILFEFNSSFNVKCQECRQKQKVKLTNLVTKEDFNNFTSVIEQKIKSGPNIISLKNVAKKLLLILLLLSKLIWLMVPFFSSFPKNRKRKIKTSIKTISYCLVYQNVHQTLQLIVSKMIIAK